MSTDEYYHEYLFKRNKEHMIGNCDSFTMGEALASAQRFAKKEYAKVYLFVSLGEWWLSLYHPNHGKVKAIVYPEGRIEYSIFYRRGEE